MLEQIKDEAELATVHERLLVIVGREMAFYEVHIHRDRGRYRTKVSTEGQVCNLVLL